MLQNIFQITFNHTIHQKNPEKVQKYVPQKYKAELFSTLMTTIIDNNVSGVLNQHIEWFLIDHVT